MLDGDATTTAVPHPHTTGVGWAARVLVLALGLRIVGLLVLAIAAAATGHSAHARLVRWDANWYAGIAAHGYGFTRVLADGRHLSDYAFFPLYPLLERAVHAFTGLGYKDSGLAISAVACVAAALGVFAVGHRVAGHRAGLILVGLWSILPTAFVLSMAYSEALFIALCAWGLVAVLDRRWLLAGLFASLAGLTRPIGAALVAAVLVAAVIEFRRRRDRSGMHGPSGQGLRPLIGGAVLAPVGWLAYVGWVGWRRGGPTGYLGVQDGWGNGIDGGRAFGTWLLRLLSDTGHPVHMLFAVLIVAAVLAVLGLFVLGVHDRLPPVLLVFSGVLIVMALSTARYFDSKPRYLFPAFPLLIPLAARLAALRFRWTSAQATLGISVIAVATSAVGAVILLRSVAP